MPSVKHIPERSCIACGKVKTKDELIRLVACQGNISVDSTGKKSGRGAYLCTSSECWESAFKGNKIERALRTSLTIQDKEQLIDYRNNLRS